jgi:hypothetical protein
MHLIKIHTNIYHKILKVNSFKTLLTQYFTLKQILYKQTTKKQTNF